MAHSPDILNKSLASPLLYHDLRAIYFGNHIFRFDQIYQFAHPGNAHYVAKKAAWAASDCMQLHEDK